MLGLNTGSKALCRNSRQSQNQGFEQPLRCSDMQTVQIYTKVTCMEWNTLAGDLFDKGGEASPRLEQESIDFNTMVKCYA